MGSDSKRPEERAKPVSLALSVGSPTAVMKSLPTNGRRLEITDMVHAAKYEFQTYHGQCYWLAINHRKGGTILCHNGPNDWSSGKPEEYEYVCQVKWLGDYTWIEVDTNSESMLK
jgi:hypothetical protein